MGDLDLCVYVDQGALEWGGSSTRCFGHGWRRDEKLLLPRVVDYVLVLPGVAAKDLLRLLFQRIRQLDLFELVELLLCRAERLSEEGFVQILEPFVGLAWRHCDLVDVGLGQLPIVDHSICNR